MDCKNDPLCNANPTHPLQGLARCKKVLHYCAEWQQGFATMRFGYARVSTQEQDTALQIGALEAAGCERVFQEKALRDRVRYGGACCPLLHDRVAATLPDHFETVVAEQPTQLPSRENSKPNQPRPQAG